MNKILEAYKVDEAASKGEINELYVNLYNFIQRYNITELNQAGKAIGLQIREALTEAYDVASKSDKKAFVDSIIKELKKI